MPVYEYAGDDAPLFVSESDYVQFRFKAPTTWDTEQTVTVRIGDLDTFWLIKTIPEDLIPDPYPFENILDAEPDTMYTYADGTRPTEQIIEVTGLTPTSEAHHTLVFHIVLYATAETNYYNALHILIYLFLFFQHVRPFAYIRVVTNTVLRYRRILSRS